MFLDYVNQQGRDLVQVAVLHVIVPSADENSIIRLDDEVITYVINDYRVS